MNISGYALAAAGTLLYAVLCPQVEAQENQEGQAKQTASARAMLEEITVTARRREESVMDLPLSISAMDSATIEAAGIQNAEQFGEFIPNTTLMTGDRANNTQIVIRGIGGGHPDPVEVFGSGIYLDGHYISGSVNGFLNTLDVERIEVLRGPQGTLFGKNVTGGAINVVTTKPQEEFGAKIKARIAENGEQSYRGMVNIPITDSVLTRFSASKELYDGYYYNRHLSNTVGGIDADSFHGALRFLASDTWTIDVSYFSDRRRDDASPVQCGTLDGALDREDEDLDAIYPGFGDDFYAACDSDVAAGQFITSSDKDGFSRVDVEAFFASANWDSDGSVGAFDHLATKISASSREREYDFLQDNEGSFYAVDTRGTLPEDDGYHSLTYNAEVILEGIIRDKFNFTVGVNYFYDKGTASNAVCHDEFLAAGLNETDANGDPINTQEIVCASASGNFNEELPSPTSDIVSNAQSEIDNESIGIFAHASYSLNEDWDIDVGVRYTQDKREYWNAEWPVDGCNFDQTGRVLGEPNTTTPSSLCTPILVMSYERNLNDGFFNNIDDTFSKTTPMLSLTRNFGDSMAYVLYSEGFLTGGFNAEVNSNIPGIEPLLTYGPETVRNYEIGYKGYIDNGDVRILADVFYMDYSDKQEEIAIDNSDGDYGTNPVLNIFTNVASVDIYGVEFELSAIPWEGGFISASFGYLKNEYSEFSYFDPEEQEIVDLTNVRIVDLTPDWTLTVGIEHEFQFQGGATLTPRLTLFAQDKFDYLGGDLDEPYSACTQDSFVKVDPRLTFAPASDAWEVSAFGNNVTNENIIDFCSDTYGVYAFRYQPLATWGVQFTARWGE